MEFQGKRNYNVSHENKVRKKMVEIHLEKIDSAKAG